MADKRQSLLASLRYHYHKEICHQIIRISRSGKSTYPNFADGSNTTSRNIAWGIIKRLNCTPNKSQISGQTAGKFFEDITRKFLEDSFSLIKHLRPGDWIYSTQMSISDFEQYEHLAYLEQAIRDDKTLESSLRGGYIISPDITVARIPVSDEEINKISHVLNSEADLAKLTPLRQANHPNHVKILHASVSCKWTIRSDRSQNTRTEALNLIRNRKGPLPHIVAVTAEPTPHRVASLALGTGDLDCVYHFALNELMETLIELGLEDAEAEFNMMVDGKRLKDISDLPFDLAI